MDVIQIVSFSKEKKWRLLKLGLIGSDEDPKWKSLEIDPKSLTAHQRELFRTYGEELGEQAQIVRDIVSDADKIEAIGLRGVDRCWQYSEELWEKKVHSEGLAHDDEEAKIKWIKARVVEHYHEKLKILGSEYIKTESGRKLADLLNSEMETAVRKFADEEGIPWIL